MKFKICSYTTSGRNLYKLHETEVEGNDQDVQRSVRMLEVLGHKITGWIENSEDEKGGQARERHDRR